MKVGTQAKTPAQEVLEEHYPYELDMLSWSLGELRKFEAWKEDEEPQIRRNRNALIECFGLHARLLIEFFERAGPLSPKDRHTEGVRYAAWFATDNYRAKHQRALARLKPRLNIELAHLINDGRSKEQISKLNGDDFENIFSLLMDEAANFKQHLRAEFQSGEFPMLQVPAGACLIGGSTCSATSHVTWVASEVGTRSLLFSNRNLIG